MNTAIDFNQGLRHCDNQLSIFSAVLEQFRQQYKLGLNIQSMLNDAQYAQLQLHTLKGLGATIGAQQLSAGALGAYQNWSTLEPDERQKNLLTLETRLQQVIQQIDLYLNSNLSLKN
ncbi:Hpt domain-containing protein [Idiomarina seosinensis]|uniref:Hpt domain-containing protein n=1 Tax=Idiomarina seosinensis TaxID=281739 RepID=A0A432ZD63_9GAMM|nr:Hpt domain-containing protein [Idiomarina seosinensis]RUO75830.1 Hpt domain-containing protein [Idiomarina seosinensis]